MKHKKEFHPDITAIAPIYILETTEKCLVCFKWVPVIAIASQDIIDNMEDPEFPSEPKGMPSIYSELRYIPQKLLDIILNKYPFYSNLTDKKNDKAIYLNKCSSCGEIIKDVGAGNGMHNEPGGAFCPESYEEYNEINAVKVILEGTLLLSADSYHLDPEGFNGLIPVK